MLTRAVRIVEGWGNYMFPTPRMERNARTRAVECGNCDKAIESMFTEVLNDEIKEIEGLVCSVCTCPLSSKLRSLNEKCPLGKW